MLTIRLARIGRKNKPMYRLVISEKSKTPTARALEYLGSYNPHTKELRVKSSERIQYWLSKGSGMSDTVNNLLISKQIIKGKKIQNSKCKKSAEAEVNKNDEAKKAPTSSDNVEKTEAVKEDSKEEKFEEKETKEKPQEEEVKEEVKEEPKKEEEKKGSEDKKVTDK